MADATAHAVQLGSVGVAMVELLSGETPAHRRGRSARRPLTHAAAALVVCSWACGLGPNRPSPQPLPVVNVKGSTLRSQVHVDRVVQPRGVLLGALHRARVDPDTQEFLVSTRRPFPMVCRIGNDGQVSEVIRSSSDSSTSFQQLQDFTPVPEGVAVLGDRRVLRYDRRGKVEAERSLPFVPMYVEYGQGALYVFGAGLSAGTPEYAVWALDAHTLAIRNRFHPYDRRINRLAYLPMAALAISGDRLLVSDIYDLGFSVYSLKGELVGSYTLPNRNAELEHLWRDELTEETETTLTDGIHRFLAVFGSWNRFYAYEASRSNGIDAFLVIRHDPVSANRYQGLRPIRVVDRDGVGAALDAILGGYGEGLIGSVATAEGFQRLRMGFPDLPDVVEITDSANPAIVLVRFAWSD